MFNGHKYKVTFLLLYYFTPLFISVLLLLQAIPPGTASISSGGSSGLSDYYFGSSGSTGNSGSHSVSNFNSDLNINNNHVRNSERTSRSSGGSTTSTAAATGSNNNNISEDTLRREFIKVQILQRLGLNEKPHVDMAHKISKDLVLETLRRTENLNNNQQDYQHHQHSSSSSSFSSYNSNPNVNERYQQQHHHYSSSNNNTFNNFDSSSVVATAAGLPSNHVDQETGVANYAKTSEIISFPDKGPVLNGHNLLSFSYAGSQAFGVGVRVKKAHLWVKLDYRSSIGRHFGHILAPKGITLYVFQVHGNFSTQYYTQSHNVNHHPTVHLKRQDVDLELVVKRAISLEALGWQKLDVTSVVQKWYGKQSRHKIRHANSHRHHNGQQQHRGDKLTLLVDCSGCGYCIQPIIFSRSEQQGDNGTGNGNEESKGRKRNESQQEGDQRSGSLDSSGSSGDEDRDYYDLPSLEGSGKVDNFTEMPFLVLETESAPNFKRSRRRALECSPRVKHCCKQRFYISFKDLDWDDWIIAPRGYYANYCRGSCGGPHRTPDTFLNYHTHVLEEYRRTPEGQVNLSGITPCCAPTKFAPMSLIYFGPDLNIIKRDLPKMIVEECGCP